MRLFLRTSVLCAIALILTTGSAFAQAEKGDKEFTIGGSVTSTSNGAGQSSTVSGNFNFGLGFFVTNGLELGISPGINISTTGGQTIITGYDRFGIPIFGTSPRETNVSSSASFFGRQHFGRARVAPYIGGNLTTFNTPGYGGGESSTIAYGNVEGGLKNYLSEKTALDLNLSVGGQLNPPEGGTSATQVRFVVGITHLF